MGRLKIDYGIDLGTTNSAIARMEDGSFRIIKSQEQYDTTTSCVFFNKKQSTLVGAKAKNALDAESVKNVLRSSSTDSFPQNGFIEFKRTMGTDKLYYCTHMDRNYSSEELSAEVLKALRGYVRDDDDFKAVVVTVPAMYQQHQVEAAHRAAMIAGFQHCELLQEPIAASMAFGITTQSTDGYWLVFDFGGGTFDVALMTVVDGIIKVHDTSGDNHLGGKNIDYGILDKILIPYIENNYNIGNATSNDYLRFSLKSCAEEIKIQFAQKSEVDFYRDSLGEDDDGEELIIDETFTIEQFNNVAQPFIQRAIDICHKLLERNNLSANDLETIILVGGPTFLETLRRMLREQISPNINVSIDPMTAVAQGAALFASTRDIPADLQVRDKVKVQLKLKYPETTVETEENLGLKVERTATSGEVPTRVFAEVTRTDKGWSSGKVEVVDDAEIIEIFLTQGKANGFNITLFDEQGTIYPCEPTSFTIIQGLKVANATLPMHICVEAIYTGRAKQGIVPIAGLEKNKTLPTKGKRTFRTQADLRPGNKDDIFEIRVYETENPSGPAMPHEWIGTIPISGDQLSHFLPKDSEVEIILKLDASRLFSCDVYFPYIDQTLEEITLPTRVQAEFDADFLENQIDKAQSALTMLSAEGQEDEALSVDDLENQLAQAHELLEEGREDHDRKTEIARRIGEVIKQTENLRENREWPQAEQELEEALEHIDSQQKHRGNEKTAQAIEQFHQQAQKIVAIKDTANAKVLVEAIHSFSFMMVKDDTGFWASQLLGMDQDFDILEWKDRSAARRLIDEGKKILVTTPTRAKIEDIVRNLFSLLPEKEDPILGESDGRLLKTH